MKALQHQNLLMVRYLGLLILLLKLDLSVPLFAQNLELQEAKNLSQEGYFDQAEDHFSQLLQNYPHHLPTQLGYAYNQSWSGNYASGIEAFKAILQEYPELEEAQIGLAYSLAWGRHFYEAEEVFQQILLQNPGKEDALKGLAYISLWRGKYRSALQQFSLLRIQNPFQPEYANALGITNLRLGRLKEARKAFEIAQQLDPGSEEAILFLSKIPAEPAFVEVHSWVGYSQINTVEKLGLRAINLQLRPNEKLQLWMRYDNSLALDNFSFVRANVSTPSWFGGGMLNWGNGVSSRLEIGQRILPDADSHFLFQAEQIYNFGNNYAVKLGGFFAPRNDGKAEFLAFGGGQIPLSEHFSLEPLYFYARNENDVPSHRAVLNAEFRSPNGDYRIGGGTMVGVGRLLEPSGTSVTTYGANLVCQALILDQHWLMLSFRYDSGIEYPLLSISSGLRLRFER